jgi:hypothetical protein
MMMALMAMEVVVAVGAGSKRFTSSEHCQHCPPGDTNNETYSPGRHASSLMRHVLAPSRLMNHHATLNSATWRC